MQLSHPIFVVLALTLSFSALAQESVPSARQPKFALLIGNSDYDENGSFTKREDTPEGRLNDLRNPCNDVKLVESKLLMLGWAEQNILTLCNVSKFEILKALQDFSGYYMSGKFPFGFIYYAGHGAQIDGHTFIFGVDTNVKVEDVVERYKHNPNSELFNGGIRLRQEVLDYMGDPGEGTILIVLDACRENPVFDRIRDQAIAITGPKRTPIPVPGLKLLYSTSEGALAGDGAGNNSPFATIFAREIIKWPSVDYVIRSVVANVYEETTDPQKRQRLFTNVIQIPDESGSLQKPPPDVCFGECGT